FVAVSLRPASSVFRRTFVRTGRERFETARLTTDRPRARFSCMTESFTSGSLQVTEPVVPTGRETGPRGPVGRLWVSSLYLLIPSSPSSWCGRRGRPRMTVRGREVDDRPASVDDPTVTRGRPVDGSWTVRSKVGATGNSVGCRPRNGPRSRREGVETLRPGTAE